MSTGQLRGEPRKRKYNNRDRIIEKALELFNARGYSEVTPNLIAEHLGISSGNLYYHFSRKEKIIDAIYLEMLSYVRRTIPAPPDRPTPADMAWYYTNSMETLWNYRAIFGNLEEMLRHSSMVGEHREFMRWATELLVELFTRLVAQGGPTPKPSEETVQVVAANTTLMITSWWRYVNTTFPPGEVTVLSIRMGASRIFSLIEPYIDPGFAADVQAIIREYDTSAETESPVTRAVEAR